MISTSNVGIYGVGQHQPSPGFNDGLLLFLCSGKQTTYKHGKPQQFEQSSRLAGVFTAGCTDAGFDQVSSSVGS